MKKQHLTIIAVGILFLAVCGFSQSAYSGNLLMMIAPLLGSNSVPYGDMNTVVKLISVSSGNSDSLTADWLPSEDTQTYALHCACING